MQKILRCVVLFAGICGCRTSSEVQPHANVAPSTTMVEHLAEWCDVDGECSQGRRCEAGVCEGHAIDSTPRSARWNSVPCWLSAERRVLQPLTPHLDCIDLQTAEASCLNGRAADCLGSGRLLQTLGESTKARTYFQRACEGGLTEACDAKHSGF